MSMSDGRSSCTCVVAGFVERERGKYKKRRMTKIVLRAIDDVLANKNLAVTAMNAA